jgi:hypothetical protein
MIYIYIGDAVDGEVCNHCRRRVPLATLVMHQLRCERVNYFCELCQIVVAKQERDEHEKIAHSDVECSQNCGAKIPRCELQVCLFTSIVSTSDM